MEQHNKAPSRWENILITVIAILVIIVLALITIIVFSTAHADKCNVFEYLLQHHSVAPVSAQCIVKNVENFVAF